MTNPHEDYQNELNDLVQIIEEEWIKQPASDDECAGYAVQLHNAAQKNRTALVEEGMPESLIDGLPAKKNAFAVAASRHTTAVTPESSKKIVYAEKKALAYELRRRLFRYGKFAFEAMPAVLNELKEIIEGSGDLDLIYDLLKLNELFLANINAFTPLVKFSETWLEEAIALHNELDALYGAVTVSVEEVNDLATIERQAFTHMYRDCLEIRKWARFVLAEDPKALEDFKAPFYQ